MDETRKPHNFPNIYETYSGYRSYSKNHVGLFPGFLPRQRTLQSRNNKFTNYAFPPASRNKPPQLTPTTTTTIQPNPPPQEQKTFFTITTNNAHF
jgi:hypothetical protein